MGDRHAPAEELRRRAELLFGERAVQRGELGTGPGEWGTGPPARDGGETGEGAAWTAVAEPEPRSAGVLVAADELEAVAVDEPAGALRRVVDGDRAGVGPDAEDWRARAGAGPEAGDWRAGTGAGLDAGDWRARVGLALRERMPVWVQTRCGLEPRSVLALAVVVVAVAAFAVQHFWTGRAQPVRAPEVVRAAGAFAGDERNGPGEGAASGGASGAAGTAGAAGADAAAGVAGAPGVVGARGAAGAVGAAGAGGGAATAEIVVDVSGKVRKPGIHRLPAGSRVVDALNAAGGVRPGTNTDGLNRARFLVDGEQVVVGGPAAGGGAMGGPAVGGAVGAGAGPGGVAAGAGPGAPVSLNTATVEQLDALPGVGPVLARHIVDYRVQQGGFRSVDELREVNGIGERRFADLRNLVRP